METKNATLNEPLSEEKWNELDFDGKEFCSWEDGHLFLKETPLLPKRQLGPISEGEAQKEIETWIHNFQEILSQANALNKEWLENPDLFKFESRVNTLLEDCKEKKGIGNFHLLVADLEEKRKQIDLLYEDNLQKRTAILEKVEEFLNNTNEATIEQDSEFDFKKVKEEWKEAPEIRKKDYELQLARLDVAEEKFYTLKRKAFEERSMEHMQNLDLKLEICEKAENLKDSSEWRKASEELDELFERWKTIGQVTSAEKNDELWNRFNDARRSFFQRKKEHSESIKTEQEANYEKKLLLVEEAERLQDSTEWRKTPARLHELMEEWKKIGRVPLEKSDELWSRFQSAKNTFFNAKRKSTKAFMATLEENYERRQALAEKAEELKNATDWEETTRKLNELMEEWKKIGPIPKAYGDEQWEGFIQARKHFFRRKDADREERRQRYHHQINNRLHQTTQFLHKLQDELAEEEASLLEFTESLNNTTEEQPKGEEIRRQLIHLISKLEQSIPQKKEKIQEVLVQQEELKIKCNEVNQKQRKNSNNG